MSVSPSEGAQKNPRAPGPEAPLGHTRRAGKSLDPRKGRPEIEGRLGAPGDLTEKPIWSNGHPSDPGPNAPTTEIRCPSEPEGRRLERWLGPMPEVVELWLVADGQEGLAALVQELLAVWRWVGVCVRARLGLGIRFITSGAPDSSDADWTLRALNQAVERNRSPPVAAGFLRMAFWGLPVSPHAGGNRPHDEEGRHCPTLNPTRWSMGPIGCVRRSAASGT